MYALLVGKQLSKTFQVLHMVLYGEIPTDTDEDLLREELKTDDEFTLCNDIDDLSIRRVKVIGDCDSFEQL
jgi:hypothetical protein